MATRTNYYRGADIGSDTLKECILARSEDFTVDDADKILKEVIWNVELPYSFAWQPYTSEISCDVEEEEELDMDEFWKIVNTELDKECDRYFMEH